MSIVGLDNISDDEFMRQIKAGARFVYYEYAISVIFLTFKNPSAIHFIRAGESSVGPGIKYSLISFFFGWWGFPFGLIYTPMALITNFGGGQDVTGQILESMFPQEQEDRYSFRGRSRNDRRDYDDDDRPRRRLRDDDRRDRSRSRDDDDDDRPRRSRRDDY